MIVIFQYFAQFKELFLMWKKIIGIWNYSVQFFFPFSICLHFMFPSVVEVSVFSR